MLKTNFHFRNITTKGFIGCIGSLTLMKIRNIKYFDNGNNYKEGFELVKCCYKNLCHCELYRVQVVSVKVKLVNLLNC